MATRNDYKIVRDSSIKLLQLAFNNSQNFTTLNDVQKARLGFYHLIIENTLGFQQNLDNQNVELVDTSLTKIIDVNYNQTLHNLNYPKMDDYGIDVVNLEEISSSEVNINLFNFKYRADFSEGHIGDTDITRSTKFLDMLFADDLPLDESENTYTHKVINFLKNYTNSDSKYICNIVLYMVSNEANGIHENSYLNVKSIEKRYGLKIQSITLDNIMSFYDTRNKDKSAKFIVSQEDLISFNLDNQTSNLSFIVKLPINELIRITSSDSDFSLEQNPSFERWKELPTQEIDHSLLYDNVRGYLGDTNYNKKIIETLKDNSQNFFLYNNGITIVAEQIESDKQINKFEIKLNNYQIVNGGQTISSIFKFLKSIKITETLSTEKINELLEPLFNSFILVRLFKVPQGSGLKNLIAEYTNSQNAISDLNLKSISKIQIQIENHFKQHNIIYARKAGDVGDSVENPIFRIGMDDLAQIIYSAQGNPEKVSSQKKKLFKDYYDEIFPKDTFDLDEALNLAKLTQEIRKEYTKKPIYNKTDQKIYYIVYLVQAHSLSILEAMDILEYALKTYDVNLTETRKLIQVKFKAHLDEIIA